MAVVALLVAVPLTIALRGGGGDQGESAAAPRPELGERQRDRRLGIALRLPPGWDRDRKAGALRLRSPDRSVLITFSAPGPARDARAVHRAALDAVAASYRRVRIRSREGQARLGGRPARVAAIAARHPRRGERLRVLVATATGSDRAYLVQVFAAGRRPPPALVEAQATIAALRLLR